MKPLDLVSLARQQQSLAIEWRRHLHQYPELRWQEDNSLQWILEQISSIKSTFPWQQQAQFSGGLVVDMTVDPQLPWQLFRADIDALPITEETGLPFTSANLGIMHACGHDAHSAMLLAAYNAVQTGTFTPSHNIRWVWQRAEENPDTPPVEESGGARLVREGVCDNMQCVHGLHIWSTHPAGEFASRPGPMMANSGRIKINIKCSGGHAAVPNLGSNALRIAHQICDALEGFAALALSPLESTVLEPTILHAGTAPNVRPSEAELWFANRHFMNADEALDYQNKLEKRIRSVTDYFEDAAVTIRFIKGHPVLRNTGEDVDRVKVLLEGAKQNATIKPPTFGGEDFAYYLQKTSGSFWYLGGHQEGTGGHHTPIFNPSEDVLWQGVLFWLLLAKG